MPSNAIPTCYPYFLFMANGFMSAGQAETLFIWPRIKADTFGEAKSCGSKAQQKVFSALDFIRSYQTLSVVQNRISSFWRFIHYESTDKRIVAVHENSCQSFAAGGRYHPGAIRLPGGAAAENRQGGGRPENAVLQESAPAGWGVPDSEPLLRAAF